jgi:hypothetical protein
MKHLRLFQPKGWRILTSEMMIVRENEKTKFSLCLRASVVNMLF